MYANCIPVHGSRSPNVSMLPEHFFGPASLATVCPEAALMCAVLEDAFFCFQKQFEDERRGIRTAQEAEEWFFSDDSCWLFSFVSICTVLGLEPKFMRQGLKHWSQSHPRLDTPQRKMYRVIGVNRRGCRPNKHPSP